MKLSPGHVLAYTVPHGIDHVRDSAINDANPRAYIDVASMHPDADEPEWVFTVTAHENGWDEPNPSIGISVHGDSFAVFRQAADLLYDLAWIRDGEPAATTLAEVVAILRERWEAKDVTAAPAPAPAAPWVPTKGDAVIRNGHGGWIVWAVDDWGGAWVYGTGTPMTSAPSRPGETVPGHMELVHVSELRPAPALDGHAEAERVARADQ
ncbi:hypothetical protein ACQP25_44680 (plasmid) [Microtetraspora malaysiensis]|uniref:hypothetical protein n=1 Tax=Microtetraspora malaysiensis TaxID=161358 RepID=UPI003D8CD788